MKEKDKAAKDKDALVYHTENWYALLISITERKSPSEALRDMECQEGIHKNRRWVWNKNITEEHIEAILRHKKLNPGKSIRCILESEKIEGISASAMLKRISRYKKKYSKKHEVLKGDEVIDKKAI